MLQGGDRSGSGLSAERVAREAALPDLEAQIDFCRRAEECHIDSLLVDINYGKPDPMVLSMALGRATEKIKFMVAYRPGLMSPALFVQQVNTCSVLTGGRIALNIVSGHSPREQRYYGDFLSHDERYERADEFLSVCHAFWERNGAVNFDGKYYRVEDGRLNTPFVSDERTHPEIYLGGSSEQSRNVALKHADCWMRFADAPEKIKEQIRPALDSGTEVGLRLSVITRPTRKEAVRAARSLIESAPVESRRADEKRFVTGSDAVSMKKTFELAEDEWLTQCLWTGAVRSFGASAMALVGTPEEVASDILEFEEAGVSQFILAGWPKLDEMIIFSREVMPLLNV
ncbi:MAG: LLM class flavin-dependent oxidoreductase [Blastocatellia bacterium]|nr:LLM class flavin-dependent oxidoreductase [Blastocatellia bacterium]